jgi:ribonuclease HI
LRIDSLHARADSLREIDGRLRKRSFTGVDYLMPKRPATSKGKSLFGEAAPEAKTAAAAAFRINIDGGSRGNPGPAAYGVLIRDANGGVVAKFKKYIGRFTNNVAEYYGLIAAMDYAQSHGVRAIRIESDSELLVKQMRGLYRVKSADLQPLYERAQKMSKTFDSFRIDHIYREHNREADALANEALDETEGKPANPAAASAAKPSSQERTGPRRVPARFRGGVLYLLEDVGLPDGTVVEVSIFPLQKRESS